MNTLYPTNRRTGRRFLSKRGKLFAAKVMWAVAQRASIVPLPLTGRLGYLLSLYPPDRRTRDLSNVLKAIEDSLTKAGVWLDDSQVDVLEVRRMPVTKGGRATIEIYDLGCEVRPV